MEATQVIFFFSFYDYGNSSLMLSIRGCTKGHRDTWQTKLPSEIRQQQASFTSAFASGVRHESLDEHSVTGI